MAKREAPGPFDMVVWHPDMSSNGKRKRRSRWGAEEKDKTFIPGMPTVIPPGLSKEQEEQYLLQLQIEEISRRLRTGDLGIPPNPDDRSPSPEPIYNNEGKRLNTREYRTRKHLEEERHRLIQKLGNVNNEYKPPADYKPPVVRVSDKVMIPQEEHPDINFVGLLIGPRGNTLKNLEKETGAKIIIRGKGSVKEGKIGRKDGQPLPGEDEPLHAYVTANNPENVHKAVQKIKEIIKQGIEVPEGQNDLRRQQLRELALLNGTLRENDGLAKLKQLQQAQTIVTNTIVCTVCGGTGHLGQDCKQKRPGDTFRSMEHSQQSTIDKAKMDSEYMSLMAELGEGPPPSKSEMPGFGGGSRPSFNSSMGDSRSFMGGGGPRGFQDRTPLALPPPQNMQSAPPRGMHDGPPTQMHNRPPFSQPPDRNMQRPPPRSMHDGPPTQMHNRPPFSQPPDRMTGPPPMNPPWQSNPNQPPPQQQQQQQQQQPPQQQQNKPPQLMSLPNTGAPPPNFSQPPPMGVPPPPVPQVSTHQGSIGGPPPPWQSLGMSSAPPTQTTTNMGVPPPGILAAPPPPPPNSQAAPTFPWSQPNQPQQSQGGMSMPPPPQGVAPPPPWQTNQAQVSVAPVPPPPPASMNIPPWQTQGPPNPGMPPPPPPQGQQGFSPVAPPPPPPNMGGMVSQIPLGVPPPPPPQ